MSLQAAGCEAAFDLPQEGQSCWDQQASPLRILKQERRTSAFPSVPTVTVRGHRAAFPPPCAPQQPHGRARHLMAPMPAAVHGAAGLSPSCILIARAIRWQQLPCHQRPAPHAVQAFAKTGLGPGPSPAAHSPRAPAPAPRAGQITPAWGKRCGTAEQGLQGEKRGKVPK